MLFPVQKNMFRIKKSKKEGFNRDDSNQPVREAVSYRGLFTAGWFSVREKHYSRLKIYDRLRASEQAVGRVA